jgi:hypothetical protein
VLREIILQNTRIHPHGQLRPTRHEDDLAAAQIRDFQLLTFASFAYLARYSLRFECVLQETLAKSAKLAKQKGEK